MTAYERALLRACAVACFKWDENERGCGNETPKIALEMFNIFGS